MKVNIGPYPRQSWSISPFTDFLERVGIINEYNFAFCDDLFVEIERGINMVLHIFLRKKKTHKKKRKTKQKNGVLRKPTEKKGAQTPNIKCGE